MTKGQIAAGIYQVLLGAYSQNGRARSEVPVDDVMEILASVAANVLVQIPDAKQRQKVMMGFMPRVDNFVKAVRQKSSIQMPADGGLILPN